MLFTAAGHCAVWQWSVSTPTIPNRRAFLWVPPDCKHVHGLIVACHNMIEKSLFERPAFRAACAENDLGIVMIFSGHDKAMDDDKNPNHPKRSALDIFLNPNYPNGGEDPKGAGEDLQKVLNALADESGYEEIRYAPLLPVGHSSAGSFVWHLYQWDASRIFAMMPFKTGNKEDGPQNIPVFDVNSEWFEYGNWDMHNVSLSAPDGGAHVPKFRANNNDSLDGYYVDIGDGHCDASDDAIAIMRVFLKAAVAARIPINTPKDAPVQLKPVSVESGWLLDAAMFGKPEGKAVAYADYKGDPKQAFWYLDKELAVAVQKHMVQQLAKKPQQIGLVQGGVASPDARMFSFSPKFLDDAGTFQLQADFVDHIDHAKFNDGQPGYYPPGTKLGHSDTPIYFRVNSGALVQVGSNTFRICPHAGPIPPQGNPWEPTIVAYNLGDKNFRPAEHPAHVNVGIINTAGGSQTLDFAKIPDQKIGVKSVKLEAKASSGLPVQFFMVSGPARIEGDTLTFENIPARAKFPVRVLISAFQWGRSVEPKVQSAGPMTQEFFISK
jgi:hypothetical protein